MTYLFRVPQVIERVRHYACQVLREAAFSIVATSFAGKGFKLLSIWDRPPALTQAEAHGIAKAGVKIGLGVWMV